MSEQRDLENRATWKTVAFAPAPPGWRLVCYVEDAARPVAGWLTQEAEVDHGTWFSPAQRVVAVIDDGLGQLELASRLGAATGARWTICGPGQPDPEWAIGLDDLDDVAGIK